MVFILHYGLCTIIHAAKSVVLNLTVCSGVIIVQCSTSCVAVHDFELFTRLLRA
jgi:hypothetical protein